MKTVSLLYKSINKNREKISIFFIVTILIFSSVYGLLLKRTILNVVERERLSKDNRGLMTEISDLETRYFSMKNHVTLEIAHAKGFDNPKNTAYISNKDHTAMVSKNGF